MNLKDLVFLCGKDRMPPLYYVYYILNLITILAGVAHEFQIIVHCVFVL